jgi:hypothetical protein
VVDCAEEVFRVLNIETSANNNYCQANQSDHSYKSNCDENASKYVTEFGKISHKVGRKFFELATSRESLFNWL